MVDYNAKYEQRTSKGANVSEKMCIKLLNEMKKVNFEWTRFGFDETNENIPSKSFVKIPQKLRNAPDFIVIGKKAIFLEAKGFRGCLKIKECDLEGYKYWNELLELMFFIYDAPNKKYKLISYEELLKLTKNAETGRYEDSNKTYYKIYLQCDSQLG